MFIKLVPPFHTIRFNSNGKPEATVCDSKVSDVVLNTDHITCVSTLVAEDKTYRRYCTSDKREFIVSTDVAVQKIENFPEGI